MSDVPAVYLPPYLGGVGHIHGRPLTHQGKDMG
jgi:hypothetical protein